MLTCGHVTIATVVKDQSKINKAGLFMTGNKLCLPSTQKRKQIELKGLISSPSHTRRYQWCYGSLNCGTQSGLQPTIRQGRCGVGYFYGEQTTWFGLGHHIEKVSTSRNKRHDVKSK